MAAMTLEDFYRLLGSLLSQGYTAEIAPGDQINLFTPDLPDRELSVLQAVWFSQTGELIEISNYTDLDGELGLSLDDLQMISTAEDFRLGELESVSEADCRRALLQALRLQEPDEDVPPSPPHHLKL